MINEIAFGLSWPVFVAWFYQIAYRFKMPFFSNHPWPFVMDWAAVAAVMTTVASVSRNPGMLLGSLVSFIIAMTIHWWRNGRLRRASKVIGEKARLLRAALVRKMRELARPRRVYRPLPVPA